MTFNAGGTSVASIQFDLTLPASISTVSVTAGAILNNAAKSVSTNLVGNQFRFIIFGLNQNVIASGALLTARFKIASGASGIPVASWDPTGSLGSIYALNRWVDATVLSRNWTVGEKVATAYAVADVAGELAGIPYTGNLGVQLVHTDQSASGNQVSTR